jgi:hypothetical protein
MRSLVSSSDLAVAARATTGRSIPATKSGDESGADAHDGHNIPKSNGESDAGWVEDSGD